MPRALREVPPTAGLALVPRDFVAAGASLEREIAAFVEQAGAQVECSGTAALVVALATLKRLSGRRSVVIPAYTCPLVALAVIRCGLRPVLCDTRPGHFDLCPRALAAACGEDTLAVLITHLGGRVADFATASALARDAGAAVIEDAAQSLGARWRGRPVGNLGDIGVYSLGVGKGLTIYSGGVLVAPDAALRPELSKTAAEMAPNRLDWELRRMVELAAYGLLYRPRGLWLAYGLPLRRKLRAGKLIEAAGDDCCAKIPLHRVGAWRKRIGANALKRLPGFLAAGTVRAAPRRSRLEAIDGVSVLGDAEGDAGVWPFLQVLLPTQQARDEALRRLWPAGLGVGRLFIHALADYPYLKPHVDGSGIPNARDFAARMLTVTNSEWLDEDDFEQVCRVLQESIH